MKEKRKTRQYIYISLFLFINSRFHCEYPENLDFLRRYVKHLFTDVKGEMLYNINDSRQNGTFHLPGGQCLFLSLKFSVFRNSSSVPKCYNVSHDDLRRCSPTYLTFLLLPICSIVKTNDQQSYVPKWIFKWFSIFKNNPM